MRACGQPSPSPLGLTAVQRRPAGPHRRAAPDTLGGAGRHSSPFRAGAHPRGPV